LPIPHSTTTHGTQESRPAALEVDDPAPEVRLPDLMGREVSLADLRVNKTLLLFWSPECSFCQEMLPDLEKRSWRQPTRWHSRDPDGLRGHGG
jgi:thiol-disulfide isomerase/thioredoxin